VCFAHNTQAPAYYAFLSVSTFLKQAHISSQRRRGAEAQRRRGAEDVNKNAERNRQRNASQGNEDREKCRVAEKAKISLGWNTICKYHSEHQ
jgi:hypothetical protein